MTKFFRDEKSKTLFISNFEFLYFISEVYFFIITVVQSTDSNQEGIPRHVIVQELS